VFDIRSDNELDAAFRMITERRIGALMVGPFSFFDLRRQKLATLAAFLKIPAMYQSRQYVVAGGLASYGSNADNSFRVLGEYAGRILKGAKPAELPVQQPTRFEMVINLKAARELGLTISPKLLALTDEVIE
jgi:putative ABC transport system substrate-binding protein